RRGRRGAWLVAPLYQKGVEDWQGPAVSGNERPMKDLTPDRWERIRQLLDAALDLEPGQRESFLAEACGDDRSLRGQVEDLIASSEKAGFLVGAPAFEVAAELIAGNRPVLSAGQQIGPYRIVRQLGSGGMGVVYLAEDTKLDRNVAIKSLPVGSARDERAEKRLIREAKAA